MGLQRSVDLMLDESFPDPDGIDFGRAYHWGSVNNESALIFDIVHSVDEVAQIVEILESEGLNPQVMRDTSEAESGYIRFHTVI